jgi:hypothetical protein
MSETEKIICNTPKGTLNPRLLSSEVVSITVSTLQLLDASWTNSQSVRRLESCVTTDGQSASLSWNKASIWGLRPDFYFCQTVAGLLMWGALSDERTVLSFTISAGPRQHSNFRVRLPWDSWPYLTVSVLRLPFSSPTTRRVTMEVFDPASTREVCTKPSPISFYHSRWPGYEAPLWRILYFISAATVCLSTHCHLTPAVPQ